MKKIALTILTIFAFSLLALGAYAQDAPRADVAAGYSLFHLNGSSGATLSGVSGSFEYNADKWVGIVWDLGVYHGSPHGASVTAATYTFGPRITVRSFRKFSPFVQALFGGSHVSEAIGPFTASTNPFAFSFGLGTDIQIGSSPLALRPQLDLFGLRANGSTEGSQRFSIGIVWNIGKQ